MEAKIRVKRGGFMGNGKGKVLSCIGERKVKEGLVLSRGRGERKKGTLEGRTFWRGSDSVAKGS